MLAKLWKKVLLAICIIACIFNIMSKLVNRHSLKENLESANDGVTVFDIFKKDEVQVSESEEIIEGVINQEVVTEPSNIENTITQEDNAVQENTTLETEENITNETTAETSEEPISEVVENEETEGKPFKFSDFTIIF